MKKYIILLLLALLPGISFARQAAGSIIYYTYEGQTLAYRVLENTENVELLGFKEDPKKATDATVPKTIKDGQDEYQVVGIGSSYGSGWHYFQQATGRIRNLTIEAQLDYISSMAFFNNNGLSSVIFTKNGYVKEIKGSAFYKCINLTRFTTNAAQSGENIFPAELISIGRSAFLNSRLQGTVILSGDITSIDQSAFYELQEINKLIINSNVGVSIGSEAFGLVSQLKEVALKGVSTIAQGCFYYCNYLNTISFSGDISKIEGGAFSWCSSIKTVYSELKNSASIASDWTDTSGITFYQTNGSDSFNPKNLSGVSSVFYVDLDSEKATITSYKNLDQSSTSNPVTISERFLSPDGKDIPVTVIGDGTTAVSTAVTSITLPSTLKTIAKNAFADNTALTSITIPESVTTIGDHAFKGCTALTGVTVGKHQWASVPTNIFDDVTVADVTLTYPNDDIDYYATTLPWKNFKGFQKQKITFMNGDTQVAEEEYVTGQSLTLNNMPTPKKEGYVFKGWKIGITEVVAGVTYTMPANAVTAEAIFSVPTSDNYVGYILTDASSDASKAQKAGVYKVTKTDTGSANGKVELVGVTSSSQTALYIPAEITSSEGKKFAVTNVAALDVQTAASANPGWLGNYKTLGESNNALQSVTFDAASQVEAINEKAFQNGTALSTLMVPASVSTIAQDAFSGCTGLKTVYWYSKADVAAEVFASVTGGTLYTNQDLEKTTYAGTSKFSTKYKIDTSNKLARVIDFASSDGVFAPVDEVVYGKDLLYTSNIGINDGSKSFTDVTSVTIPPHVLRIEDNTFSGATNLEKVEFTQGSSLMFVGKQAFMGTTSLKTIDLPRTVTSVDEGAFQNSGLETITLPTLLTNISKDLFNGCSHLTNFAATGALESLGSDAFTGTGIKGLHLICDPDIVITAAPFDTSTGIDTLYISGAESVSGFSGYTNLKAVILDNCKTIKENAFSGCIGLTTVTIDAPTIEQNAFTGCSDIGSLNIGSHVTSIGENAYSACTTNLKQVNSQAKKAPSAEGSFGSTSFSAMLYTPTDAEGYGTDVDPWKYFTNNHMYTVTLMSDGSKVGELHANANDKVTFYPYRIDAATGQAVVNFSIAGTASTSMASVSLTLPTNQTLTTWTSGDVTITDNAFTMPRKDIVLNASLTAKTHKVVLQYTKDGKTETALSDDAKAVGTEVKYPSLPEFEGYEHDTWSKALESIDTKLYTKPEYFTQEGFTMPDGEVLLNVAYTPIEYTITYVVDGTKKTDSQTYRMGEEAAISVVLQPETGKSWTWMSDDVKISADNTFTMPAKNVTITAIQTDVTHTITYTYLMQDGMTQKKAPTTDTYYYNAVVTPASLSDLATDGYKAVWKYFTDAEFKTGYNPSYYQDGTFNMPNADLYAKPDYSNEYTVTTVVGSNSQQQGTYAVGETVTLTLSHPETTAEQSFSGWTSADATLTTTEDEQTKQTTVTFTMPANDVTITAQFGTAKYTLTYTETNPVTLKVTTTTTEVAAGAIVTVASPTVTTYTTSDNKDMVFTGWTFPPTIEPTNGKFVMPAENVTATATADNYAEIAEGDPGLHTLTVVDDTTGDKHTYSIYKGLNIMDKIGDSLNKTGYKWALSDNTATVSGAPTVMPDNDLKLYVIYTAAQFTITYRYHKDDNVVTLATDSYSADDIVTPRTAPTFEGYTFSGWTTIPSKLQESIVVEGWYTKNSYILTFEVDGEVYSKTENMVAGQAITVPTAPTKADYVFSGWQWPDNKVLSTMPASNLTVSGYFYQSTQKVTDRESGLAYDIAVTGMNGNTGNATLQSLPEAVLKGQAGVPSQISAGGNTYTVTKVAASAFDNLAEGVIVYLPEGASTTADVENVVNNASTVKSLDLTKVTKFGLPSWVTAIKAEQVRYTRTFAGRSTVVCMPYEVAVPKGFKAYTLKGANSKKAQFEEFSGEKMAAYKPYLLVKQADEAQSRRTNLLADDAGEETQTIDLSAKNVTIMPEPEDDPEGDYEMSLYGAVTSISNDRGYIFGMYKLQADGSWDMTAVENDPSEYIEPFSGYLIVTNSLIEGKVGSIVGDETTGIGSVAADRAADDAWYDLSGRRLSAEPTARGIYIHKGKKVRK